MFPLVSRPNRAGSKKTRLTLFALLSLFNRTFYPQPQLSRPGLVDAGLHKSLIGPAIPGLFAVGNQQPEHGCGTSMKNGRTISRTPALFQPPKPGDCT